MVYAAVNCIGRRAVYGLLCFAVFASQAIAAPWPVAEQIMVNTAQVSLADLTGEIADGDLYQRFSLVPVIAAPRVGERRVITRSQVLNAMHRVLGFTYDQQISLPSRITIERSGGVAREEDLKHSAQIALEKQWTSSCVDELTLTLRRDIEFPLLPSEKVKFVARTLPSKSVSSRMQVWVDVFEQDVLYRSIPVWFDVVCKKPVAVAVRTMSAGDVVNENDVSWDSMDVASLSAKSLPDAATLAASELLRGVSASEVISMSDIKLRPLVRRNTQVELLVHHRQMQISVTAIALADAGMNEIILAKTTLGTGKQIRARVVGVGRMEIVE